MIAQKQKMEELSYHITYIEGLYRREDESFYGTSDENSMDGDYYGYDDDSEVSHWSGNENIVGGSAGDQAKYEDHTCSSTTGKGEHQMFANRDSGSG
jgi:hypothetical protein